MRTQHRKCFDLVCIHVRRDYVSCFRIVMEGRCSARCQTVIGFVDSILHVSIVPSTGTLFSGTAWRRRRLSYITVSLSSLIHPL